MAYTKSAFALTLLLSSLSILLFAVLGPYSDLLAVAPLSRLTGVLRQLPLHTAGTSYTTVRKLSLGSMATRTPTQAPPSYTHTPNTVVSVAKELIEKSRSNQDRIAKEVTPETATFDNVIKPLAEDEDEFSNESHIIGFYQYVSVDKDLRDASSEAEKLLDVSELD